MIEISQTDIQKRLDAFIAKSLDYNRKDISSAIDEGIILVNNKKQKPSYKLKLNDVISYDENKLKSFLNPDKSLAPYDYKLDIVYEDDYLLVINKPKEMLTHPTKYDRSHTLVNALINHCDKLSDIQGEDRKGIVHRLDKNTAGLILVAKDNKVHKDLALQIKEKSAIRKYLAISLGEFEQKEATIDKALVHYLKDDVKMTVASEGLKAITNYKVIKQYKGAALVELELKTGRTHQIRAHLASINHPVFGDELYGAKSFMRNEFYNLKTKGQLLQSYYIRFVHPISKKELSFELKEEDFSEDFIKVLNFLRRNND